MSPRVDGDRLLARIDDLARIGARDGGCSRLALTDEDRAARDLVVGWMREAGMHVSVDRIGNVVGMRPGALDLPPVMTGSHLDTVTHGGRLDGAYGVLAGLEVVRTLNDRGLGTRHPLAVTVFTNEEGVRFTPDMMGSLVWAGGLELEEALAARSPEGAVLGEELARIGYDGDLPCGALRPARFVELHIEQGPVLEREAIRIGAVEDLVGISWQELTLDGQANHAGTTPMELRRDPGLVAARTVAAIREVCSEVPGLRGTCGVIRFEPGAINVVPRRATLTVDLRHPEEAALARAEAQLAERLARLAAAEGVEVTTRRLARFPPVTFDPGVVETVVGAARSLGHSHRRMTSGAGHDAQMMARICPAGMIFVPSEGGVSHNPAESTCPDDLVAGADVLLHTLVELAGR